MAGEDMFGFALASVFIAHVVADFYAQSDELANAKLENARALIAHCISYALVFGVCAILFLGGSLVGWVVLVGCAGHAAIDVAKFFLQRQFKFKQLTAFVADQAAHVAICTAIIVACSNGLELSGPITWVVCALGGEVCARGAELILALLIVGKPSEILVSLILAAVQSAGGEEGQGIAESPAVLRAGRWIGILERIIVVVMTLWNEFGAIAFVLTAKSIARFDLLKDQSFAERYLIGTLASAAAAILAALLARGLVGDLPC